MPPLAPPALHGQAELQFGAAGGSFAGDDYENAEIGYSIGAKAGYARQSFEALGVDLNSDGFTAGPELGVSIPLSSLGLEVSGEAMYVAQEISEDELVDPDADGDETGGVRYALKVALVVPLNY